MSKWAVIYKKLSLSGIVWQVNYCQNQSLFLSFTKVYFVQSKISQGWDHMKNAKKKFFLHWQWPLFCCCSVNPKTISCFLLSDNAAEHGLEAIVTHFYESWSEVRWFVLSHVHSLAFFLSFSFFLSPPGPVFGFRVGMVQGWCYPPHFATPPCAWHH